MTLGIFGEVFVRGRVIVPGDAAAFLAELGLSLWLIVKGVNVPKWEEGAQE